ncbi:hypothetical protein [Embleya sp. NPDC020886]|uniref:hypothetical protein n=1 Tax=Embleya sp. NPDC020886 TaxID=3363980 RepID=UPI0037B2CA57
MFSSGWRRLAGCTTDHARLGVALPELVAAGQAHADSAADPDAFARPAACHDLTTETLSKIGRYQRARTAADRATVYAHHSGSPPAASSARMLGIVLRHQGREATAQRGTPDAARRTRPRAGETTGLTTPQQAAAYAQMRCTAAYTCAGVGDRANALELMADASPHPGATSAPGGRPRTRRGPVPARPRRRPGPAAGQPSGAHRHTASHRRGRQARPWPAAPTKHKESS